MPALPQPGYRVLGLIMVDLNTSQMDDNLKEETVLIATLVDLPFSSLAQAWPWYSEETYFKPLSLLSGLAQRMAAGIL